MITAKKQEWPNCDCLFPLKKGLRGYSYLRRAFVLVLMVLFTTSISYSHTGETAVKERSQSPETGRVKGKVLDDGGEPLPGVTIQIEGKQGGVITNEDGLYELLSVPVNAILVYTYIGMEVQKIGYKGQTTLDVILQYKADELAEVSVVAFGRQKKESVLASITTITPASLKVPSSNLTTAFAGRVAGLISYQQSGEPGQDNSSFFIRGITTFGANAKKDPLILIDGIELSTDDLARLNTDDIASFSIMKDAMATALYGARGANGVISVTTKEGTEGKVKINFRIENSFSSPTKKIKTADPITFMRMHNEAIRTRDPLGIPIYSQEKIIMSERGLYPDIYPTTDWYDTMFDDVISNQRANLSVSGGGAIARYYVAANFAQDNGNMKVDKRNNFNSNISLSKYSVRSNVNINLTPTTELILRMNASFDEYTGPIDGGAAMYSKVMQANPVLFKPYYEPDENFAYAKHILFGNSGHSGYLNPYAESLKGYRDQSKNQMLVVFELKQKLDMIAKGLTARAMINLNRHSQYIVDRQYFPFYYDIQSHDLSTNSYQLRRLNPDGGTETINYMPNPKERKIDTSTYLEAASEYNTQIGSVHNLNALAVFTMRNAKQGISETLQLSLPARNMGVSGRFAYNFDSRYFGEFNFGYNGSERFSKNNRWGFFPSVGAAWMVSNEAFFDSLSKHITQLKLKATYGLVGNDAIGDAGDRFYYLSEVEMFADKKVNWGTQLNYNPRGINVKRYANDKIGWEKAYKTNIGAEISLRNGFSTIFDIFKEKRENILLNRVVPATMGVIPDIKANLGEAEGKGFDVELNYEKSVNKDLWFTGRGTFTYATSKALKWEEPDYSKTPWLSRIGHSLGQEWGYIAERLFVDELEVKNSPTQFGQYGAGDIKYKDINGDGKISALDKVPIGFPTTPEINYGFGLSAGYKGFDASFFFQGSGRQSFWVNLNKTTPFRDGDIGENSEDGRIGQNAIIQAFADSYWTESDRNPYALWPRLATYDVDNNREKSTWFMQDATFLRLKTVEIGYTLPQKVTKRFFVNNLRVYGSGTNLLTWSRFKLWDPEMAGNGLGYPIQRVFNVGVTIGL